jgi:hypothetical protein
MNLEAGKNLGIFGEKCLASQNRLILKALLNRLPSLPLISTDPAQILGPNPGINLKYIYRTFFPYSSLEVDILTAA